MPSNVDRLRVRPLHTLLGLARAPAGGVPFQFEYANRVLVVVADISLGRPANRTGHPDTWTPPEGATIEDGVLWLVDGDTARRMDDIPASQLLNDDAFTDALLEEWALRG